MIARDEQIFELIEAEKQRQLNGLELIASENFVSDQVMAAAGSVLQINTPRAIRVNGIMVDVKLLMK